MDKPALREQLKRQRQKLSADEVAELSHKITDRLLETLDLLSIQNFHTYLPIKGQNEVDTLPLLKMVWRKYPHIKTATWDSHGKNAKAVWVDQKGRKSAVPADLQFDVIIVPVLGFDENNHRLGFGGGFYDRFLASQPQALKIGLAYQHALIASNLPIQPHDVQLDLIITEDKVYSK